MEMEMEGSMRMMSWSRYHCLSWSFMRIRARLRHDRLVRAGHKAAVTANSAPAAKGTAPGRRRHQSHAAENAGAGCPLPCESNPQPRMLRTKTGPGDTDVRR